MVEDLWAFASISGRKTEKKSRGRRWC